MAKFKYIGAPHDVEVASIWDKDPEWCRDGHEWNGVLDDQNRYRLVFSTAEGPEYAGYAVCLGDATEAPPPQPAVREVFTVYLVSGQRCEWPLNKPEELVAVVSDSGSLYVDGPRDIPPTIFAHGQWTHCGVVLVEQPS